MTTEELEKRIDYIILEYIKRERQHLKIIVDTLVDYFEQIGYFPEELIYIQQELNLDDKGKIDLVEEVSSIWGIDDVQP